MSRRDRVAIVLVVWMTSEGCANQRALDEVESHDEGAAVEQMREAAASSTELDASQLAAARLPATPPVLPPLSIPPTPVTALKPGTIEYAVCFLGFGLCAAARPFATCALDAAAEGCLPMEVATCAEEARECVASDPTAAMLCNDEALRCLCDIPSVAAGFGSLAPLGADVCG